MSLLKNLSTTSGVFFVVVVVVLSIVSAQNDLELSSQSELESMEEIQELLRNVQLIFETKIASKVREGMVLEDEEEEEEEEDGKSAAVDANGCNCRGLKCSCCQHIRIKVFKVKDNCCLSVTYLPRNYGILESLTIGRRTIFSKEVSARNPPPICVGVPFWRKGASVCIQFYNLNVAKKSLSGCSRFRATLLYVTVAKFNLGCFRINYLKNSTQEVDEVDLPYFDGPQGRVEGPGPILDLGEERMVEIQPADYKKNEGKEDCAH